MFNREQMKLIFLRNMIMARMRKTGFEMTDREQEFAEALATAIAGTVDESIKVAIRSTMIAVQAKYGKGKYPV